ncbi:uncharacterized protein FIBRA_04428 [Fibroporia radiculosa]|uniref:Uncharacterized protein n=1 Tax=Fibroporia radiculosa TaxID=599839 RepID=J4IA58_9APHY|nr:uncharacterized protein FIBRA_04428 [Fibroporia radiculosa]CCM02336.1 predicted protein [Fibroporia radiculosa]
MSNSESTTHWQGEIMQQYLEVIEKEREAGYESDEAMSTDSEYEEEHSLPVDVSHISSAISSITLYDATHPEDIESDDSAFSSDDEYANDNAREEQRLRRLLVLGRAPPSLLLLRGRQLTDMQEAYMKQLNDADIELAELTNTEPQTIAQRPITVDYREPVDLRGPDVTTIVRELRMRSQKEIAEVEKPDAVRSLVLLAQALFRKERDIKRIYATRE